MEHRNYVNRLNLGIHHGEMSSRFRLFLTSTFKHDTYLFQIWVFGIGISSIIKIHNQNPQEYRNIPANVISLSLLLQLYTNKNL